MHCCYETWPLVQDVDWWFGKWFLDDSLLLICLFYLFLYDFIICSFSIYLFVFSLSRLLITAVPNGQILPHEKNEFLRHFVIKMKLCACLCGLSWFFYSFIWLLVCFFLHFLSLKLGFFNWRWYYRQLSKSPDRLNYLCFWFSGVSARRVPLLSVFSTRRLLWWEGLATL